MNFLKRFFRSPGSFFTFTVKCDRCGESIDGHINLDNELSAEYEGDRVAYHVRKVLMGSGLCFQRIEVEYEFDASRKIIDRHASGGRFVESSKQ